MAALTDRELELLDDYDNEARVLALCATDRDRGQWQQIFAARRAYQHEHEQRMAEALSRSFDFGAAEFFDRTNMLMRQRSAVPL